MTLQTRPILVYDNYRMSKQPISVTLSPDNLVWLKGRARVEGKGSLSEFLDALVTRARFGTAAPRPVRSMKGALAGLGGDPADDSAGLPAAARAAWQAKWDAMLEGVPETWTGTRPGPASGRPGEPTAATVRPAGVPGKRRRG